MSGIIGGATVCAGYADRLAKLSILKIHKLTYARLGFQKFFHSDILRPSSDGKGRRDGTGMGRSRIDKGKGKGERGWSGRRGREGKSAYPISTTLRRH